MEFLEKKYSVAQRQRADTGAISRAAKCFKTVYLKMGKWRFP